METLGSIAHGGAVVLFWLFALIAIGALILAVVGLIAMIANWRDRGTDAFGGFIGMFVAGIIIMIIFIFFSYFISGSSGYRQPIKDKYNRVVHFSSKEIKLEKKVRELSGLRQQLSNKQIEVKKLQSEYQNDINTLTAEIKSEQKRNKIQTFNQARQHPRISYDLSLIQRKRAYIAKLKETEVKLQNGTYELEFLERQAVDDLKIVKTLGTEEVEKLVADISNVINKYMPEAGELAIEVDPRSMQTPEQIWQQINSGK